MAARAALTSLTEEIGGEKIRIFQKLITQKPKNCLTTKSIHHPVLEDPKKETE